MYVYWQRPVNKILGHSTAVIRKMFIIVILFSTTLSQMKIHLFDVFQLNDADGSMAI